MSNSTLNGELTNLIEESKNLQYQKHLSLSSKEQHTEKTEKENKNEEIVVKELVTKDININVNPFDTTAVNI